MKMYTYIYENVGTFVERISLLRNWLNNIIEGNDSKECV